MSLPRLSKTRVFCLTACLLVLNLVPTNCQNEGPLRTRILKALEAKQSGWKYGDTLESTYIPRVPGEKRVLAGLFVSPKSVDQNVRVSVYDVESIEKAVGWLRPYREKLVPDGWLMSKIQIGDEAYLGTYKDGQRFQIEFRKGTIVSELSADDLARAQMFAQFIVEQIDAK